MRKFSFLKRILISTLQIGTFSLSSCTSVYMESSEHSPAAVQDRAVWAAYKSSSPFWPYKMWAFSLPDYEKASLSCVSNKNFAALSKLVSESENVGNSASSPDIQRHIRETTSFWKAVIAAQPELLSQAIRIDNRIEDAAKDGFKSGYKNSNGRMIDRGHIAGISGLFNALANMGPMMELFRPHVARYAPEALRLARQEQYLDRRFGYRHPSTEALQKNVEALEFTVSEIRNY